MIKLQNFVLNFINIFQAKPEANLDAKKRPLLNGLFYVNTFALKFTN